MKSTGKLNGAVIQIAFILTALRFQSLISAPAMTSLCYFLSPLPVSSLPSSTPSIPFFPSLSCFSPHFLSCLYMNLRPSTSPYITLLYSITIRTAQSQRGSCGIYLHDVGGKKKWSRNTLEASLNGSDHYP